MVLFDDIGHSQLMTRDWTDNYGLNSFIAIGEKIPFKQMVFLQQKKENRQEMPERIIFLNFPWLYKEILPKVLLLVTRTIERPELYLDILL